MLLKLALALALTQPQSHVPGEVLIDTGEVEAIREDCFPYLFRCAKRMGSPSIPDWATQVTVHINLSGRAAIDLENLSDTPVWGEGSLSVRYDRWHDSFGWWCWFGGNSGAQFVIPASNPIPPHQSRTVYLYWSDDFFPFDDPAVWGWRDKYDWFLADCYYPVIIRVRDQPVNPQHPEEAWALGLRASVGGEYTEHKFPPIARTRIRAEYQ